MSADHCKAFIEALRTTSDPSMVNIGYRPSRILEFQGHSVALYAHLKLADKRQRMTIDPRMGKYMDFFDRLAEKGCGVMDEFPEHGILFKFVNRS